MEQKPSVARSYFVALVGTAILLLFGTTFCVQAFEIPSESMEDTLLVGDRPLVDKLAYAPPAGVAAKDAWLGSL